MLEPPEPSDAPEEEQLSITSPEETNFWLQVSQVSLGKIWDNGEDNVYEELLK